MSQILPRIVQRFPKYRAQILVARKQDSVLDELCRDYDTVLRVLETEEERRRTGGGNEDKYRELVQLARDLERELLTRLAEWPQPGSENQEV